MKESSEFGRVAVDLGLMSASYMTFALSLTKLAHKGGLESADVLFLLAVGSMVGVCGNLVSGLPYHDIKTEKQAKIAKLMFKFRAAATAATTLTVITLTTIHSLKWASSPSFLITTGICLAAPQLLASCASLLPNYLITQKEAQKILDKNKNNSPKKPRRIKTLFQTIRAKLCKPSGVKADVMSPEKTGKTDLGRGVSSFGNRATRIELA